MDIIRTEDRVLEGEICDKRHEGVLKEDAVSSAGTGTVIDFRIRQDPSGEGIGSCVEERGEEIKVSRGTSSGEVEVMGESVGFSREFVRGGDSLKSEKEDRIRIVDEQSGSPENEVRERMISSGCDGASENEGRESRISESAEDKMLLSGNFGTGIPRAEAGFNDGSSDGLVESSMERELTTQDSDSPSLESSEFSGQPGSWMHGFEIGDMVWGKVKSHPWWPGHIFNVDFATPSLRRMKREGHVLVAFFGDSSYGWFDPTELIPFGPFYAEKSKQTSSRNFVKAVEEAIDEASRRQALGLSCRCWNPFNFRHTSVPGFFAVDVVNYEFGGVYSIKQIKKARDGFVPVDVTSFVKKLAVSSRDTERGTIDWVNNMAILLALRKATFEEFDETYAQAFGVEPVRPSRDALGILEKSLSLAARVLLGMALFFNFAACTTHENSWLPGPYFFGFSSLPMVVWVWRCSGLSTIVP